MNKTLIASLLVAVSAAIAAPAFASSGYGPSPAYRPLVGAPASQRGQSAQTIAAEQAAEAGVNAGVTSYGGVASTVSDSGRRAAGVDTRSLYSHN